jgi:hypothetical protein
MTDHDETGDERKAPEAASSESEPVEAPASEDAPRREVRRSKPGRSGRRASAREGSERKAKAEAAPAGVRSSAVLIAVIALAAGGAAGWFGHIAQAKATLRAESAPAPAGSSAGSGPCSAWEKQICKGGGEESAACQQAKGATELLTPSTCEAGLASMPATLAKVKAARVPCETLVSKLCTDLPPGSKTCDMVKERTPSFPGERCREMLTTYDTVLGELKMLDQQMGQGQMGMPPGAMPPGAMPPGTMPPEHP